MAERVASYLALRPSSVRAVVTNRVHGKQLYADELSRYPDETDDQ